MVESDALRGCWWQFDSIPEKLERALGKSLLRRILLQLLSRNKVFDEVGRAKAMDKKFAIFGNEAPNSVRIWAANATALFPTMTPAEPVANEGKSG